MVAVERENGDSDRLRPTTLRKPAQVSVLLHHIASPRWLICKRKVK